MAVDTAKFQGDLGRAAAIAERRMKNIRDTASRALGALTIAATAAGGALVTLLGRSLRDADEMLKLAKSIGTTVEQLSALRFAADLSGVSQEELGVALKKLASTAVDASNDVKTASAAFRSLGIDTERSNGSLKSVDELINEIADAFSAAPDSITKTAIATDLFGKSGAKLIPLLNEGRAGLDRFRQEAERLGIIIDTKTAVAAEQFNDNLARLKATISGFGNLLAAELAPSLAAFSDQLVQGAVGLERMRELAASAANVVRFFTSVFIVLGTAIEATGKNLGAFAAAFDQFFIGNFREAAQIIRDRMADARREIEQSSELVKALYSEQASEIAAAAPKIGAELAAPITEAAKLSKEATEELERYMTQSIWGRQQELQLENPLGPTLAEDARALAETFHEINRENIELSERTIKVKNAFEEADKAAKGLMETIQDELGRRALGTLSDLIYNMGRGAKNFGDQMLEAFRRILADQAAKQIIALLSGLGGGGGGGFLGAIASGIGALFSGGSAGGGGGGGGARFSGFMAAGGTLRPGEFGVVGERGPELALGGMHGQTIVPMSRGGKAARQIVATYAPVYHFASGVNRAEIEPLLNQRDRANQAQFLAFFRDQLSRGAFA